MKPMNIILPHDVRYFELLGGKFLEDTGKFLRKNRPVLIESLHPSSLYYDGKHHRIVSFRLDDEEFYLIVSEIGIDNLLADLEQRGNGRKKPTPSLYQSRIRAEGVARRVVFSFGGSHHEGYSAGGRKRF